MIIKNHSQLSDEAFEEQFRSYTLKPHLFSHEAHLRLAYIHIKKYGLEQAEQNMCDQIKGYAESLGATNKFNKTVTIAATKAVYHFMQRASSGGFDQLIQEFPRLNSNFRDLIGKHYGFNVFKDEKAKKEYVEPDLLPFS